MPFFGALWIWDPFISLDELSQNCIRPTTFADVNRNLLCCWVLVWWVPSLVFSPRCVCGWLLPPPSSPFPQCLQLLHHGFIHSAQIILGSCPSPRSSFCFGLLVCCLRLSLASSGWPHLNPNDPEPFAVEQTIIPILIVIISHEQWEKSSDIIVSAVQTLLYIKAVEFLIQSSTIFFSKHWAWYDWQFFGVFPFLSFFHSALLCWRNTVPESQHQHVT